ncbi:alpha-L-fucosidase [Dactylonectria estremocensis]|uniref:Alpha-L-fucosidase n=1 Tax=Dactylonectria estremocensis TaxID=1079267 RepID=A0A9P9JE53_9HYPO|nr:alpha-L-fucosidase [Dactylonectria estremocensis]
MDQTHQKDQTGQVEQTGRRLHLHYSAPATEWAQALPIGNGRLGCMIHGRPSTELWQLNEDSVWYGGAQDRTPKDAFKHLATLRQLIRDAKHAEAEELVRAAFFSSPTTMRHYEPLGSCYLEFGHDGEVTNYRRHLDLETAIHTVKYDHDGISHERQSFASFPDGVLATRITSSEPIRFVIRLNRVGEQEWDSNEFLDSVRSTGNRIILHATPGGRGSNKLCIVLGICVSEGGSVEAIGSNLIVHASSCVVAIGAYTTYRHEDPKLAAGQRVDVALGKSWENLVATHLKDYQSLFTRTSLSLQPDASHIPTDERIKNHRDPGLVALYHNYGRYLLISSSRNASKALPANLQGIWNPSFSPPWGCKFTININIQMNYWPAGPSNLVESALPLLNLLQRMAIRGETTAKTMYGCRGWCAHHNTDIWADTDPADKWMPSTLWPLGGVWLCMGLVELLQYRYDRQLHEQVAPLLEGCIEFIVDFLIPSKDGKHLVTCPSLSPENTFISSNGSTGILCEGSVIDISIIRIAFEQYIWSHQKLLSSARTDLVGKVQNILNPSSPLDLRLPDIKINSAGLIQEWGLEDYAEHEPGHRHVSHLFGLYPGNIIHPDTTSELAKAAQKVLDRRAEHGGGHTGWSRAWLLNLHARLRDAEGCGKHMDQLLESSTLPNLLDSHPPFQIDGNFGGCAGIVECLLQSRIDDDSDGPFTAISLLPACPVEWSSGQLKDVGVKGGWLVSFAWEEGRIQSPTMKPRAEALRVESREDKFEDGVLSEVPADYRKRYTTSTGMRGGCACTIPQRPHMEAI